ncbi:MAG: cytochrome-c peroxidase [Flavobacteriales bacterium]|nr:cytochrome-c peroxidase [Flavobacteriales bacterium]
MLKVKYVIPVILVFLVAGCKKDDVNNTYETTPYEFNLPPGLPSMDVFIPEDNPMTVEGVALGRKIFYDPILSGDGTMACASCHKQESGFSDPHAHSTGIDGIEGTRNAMAVVNLGWNQFGFFWDGRAKTLEDQALQPVVNPIEMHTTWPEVEAKLNASEEYKTLFKQAYDVDYIDSMTVVKAIASFERTLISGNSRFDQWYTQQSIQLTDQELRGYVLYSSEQGDCFHCHTLGGFLTDNKYHNNGMDSVYTNDEGRFLVSGDPMDMGRFRTPTLRNIEMTAPYMHDGRFFTLEEVLDHYNEHILRSPTLNNFLDLHLDPNQNEGGLNLSADDKAALIAFLKTMTDPDFINNPDFSDPNP